MASQRTLSNERIAKLVELDHELGALIATRERLTELRLKLILTLQTGGTTNLIDEFAVDTAFLLETLNIDEGIESIKPEAEPSALQDEYAVQRKELKLLRDRLKCLRHDIELVSGRKTAGHRSTVSAVERLSEVLDDIICERREETSSRIRGLAAKLFESGRSADEAMGELRKRLDLERECAQALESLREQQRLHGETPEPYLNVERLGNHELDELIELTKDAILELKTRPDRKAS